MKNNKKHFHCWSIKDNIRLRKLKINMLLKIIVIFLGNLDQIDVRQKIND